MNGIRSFLHNVGYFFHQHHKDKSESKSDSSRTEVVANSVFKDLYIVKFDDTESLNPLAIKPKITPNGQIEWKDTSQKGRSFEIKSILLDGVDWHESNAKHPKKIEIVTMKNERIELERANIEDYNEKRRFIAGQPKFNDTNELQEYYLNNY